MAYSDQIKRLAFYLIPPVFLLVVLGLVSAHFDVAIGDLTRDPLAIARVPPYIGFLSNLGVILWSAAVAVCLLSFHLLGRRGAPVDIRGFVVFGGLISLLLLLDDLYQLHEFVFPRLGVFEKVVFAMYGGMVLGYLIRFRMRIRDTKLVYLISALGLFAMSLLIDRLPETLLPMHHLWEDGSKFLGIVCWLGYQTSISLQYLESDAAL